MILQQKLRFSCAPSMIKGYLPSSWPHNADRFSSTITTKFITKGSPKYGHLRTVDRVFKCQK